MTYLACNIPRWYTCPKMVTHPSTKRARRVLTSFMRWTPPTTMPCRQHLYRGLSDATVIYGCDMISMVWTTWLSAWRFVVLFRQNWVGKDTEWRHCHPMYELWNDKCKLQKDHKTARIKIMLLFTFKNSLDGTQFVVYCAILVLLQQWMYSLC